jgi:hypothetical protein
MPYDLELPNGDIIEGIPDDVSENDAVLRMGKKDKRIAQFAPQKAPPLDIGNQQLACGQIGGEPFQRPPLSKQEAAGVIGGQPYKWSGVAEPSVGPQPSTGAVISGIAQALPQGLDITRAGLRQQFADVIGLEEMSKRAGQEYARAQGQVELSTPQFKSATAGGLYEGGTSLARTLPGVALGFAGGPVLGLGTLGAMTEAEAYGKYKQRKATNPEAALGALGEGAVEVATEVAPMGFLLKTFGKMGMKQFLVGLLARELPGEEVATLAQDAIDTAIANPNKTWGDYIAERPEAAYRTALATLVQSGIIGGIGAGVQGITQAGPANITPVTTGKPSTEPPAAPPPSPAPSAAAPPPPSPPMTPVRPSRAQA